MALASSSARATISLAANNSPTELAQLALNCLSALSVLHQIASRMDLHMSAEIVAEGGSMLPMMDHYRIFTVGIERLRHIANMLVSLDLEALLHIKPQLIEDLMAIVAAS